MIQEFLVSLITVFVYCLLKTRKAFHMLQQNWYDKSFRFLKWNFRNLKKSLFEIDIIMIPVLIISYVLKVEYIFYVIASFYFLLTIIYLRNLKHEQVKKKLVYTARLK